MPLCRTAVNVARLAHVITWQIYSCKVISKRKKTTIFDQFIEKEGKKKWKIDKKKKRRNEARIHRFSRRVSQRPLTRIEKLASSIVPRNKHGSLPKSEEIRAA